MNNRVNGKKRIIECSGRLSPLRFCVVEDNEMKEKNSTNRTNVIGRARALVLALMMALTMVTVFAFQTGSFAYAAGTTERVATFDQLKAALEKGSVTEIVIDPQAAEELTDNLNEDGEKGEVTFTGSDVFYIPIEYPLVVSRDITIRSEVSVNFARSGSG